MDGHLKNQIIVITGGCGLLGRGFVNAILENGGGAIIADYNPLLGKELKRELQSHFRDSVIDYVNIDITDSGSLDDGIKILHEKYGRIDALVNNAYPRNVNYGRDFDDVTYEDFSENISMNLGGYFLTSQKFSKYFYAQGHGNIINISSIYGVIPPKFEIYNGTPMTMPVEYAVIKSGLIHLTKYMAKLFKDKNIKVNSISPGGILNDQPKEFVEAYNAHCSTKGMLHRDDLKGALVFLLSESSQYMNGQNLIIDDGFTL